MNGQAGLALNVVGILFSRDRAMQLDATLRSFFRHCRDSHLVDLHVIYRATGPLHVRQYAALEREHAARPNVHFVRQTTFRSDVLRLLLPGARRLGPLARLAFSSPRLAPLTGARAGRGAAPFVLFLVDDNLFVRPFSLQAAAAALRGQPRALGFSLRLGANTHHCYTTDRPQTVPAFTALGEGIVSFDWTSSDADFGYPLEVSSSLYRTAELAPLLAALPFRNPNQLEMGMAGAAGRFRSTHPLLLSFERSATFCNPVNIVQREYANRGGAVVSYTSDRLARMFDEGLRIRLAAYDGFVPDGCHQEVELAFEAGEAVG